MDTPFEGLGVFYLGRTVDDAGAGTPLLYDSRDLTTHAVCVGMTGSGKTGLCVTLLEEAAIDGIPAVVIDPKGDLADLMLAFPDLSPASFLPWVSEDAARRQGISADELAAREAERWRQGLVESGQDGERIRRMQQAAEFAVYTPGSDAARPVSVVSSLAPPRGADGAGELLTERAAGVASSLLSLIGVDADPVRSREHILVTTLLQEAWSQGRALDLAGLVQAVQKPPFSRVGVMELESFLPSKERFALAMLFNNLLASPTFQPWLSGEALDVDRLLYTETGKPRVVIFSIAHLDDAQRMFFTSLLLNEVVAWMRTRPGTSSLRALVYMDEIFGYLPPVENPPSKKPLLTLMKQARAFGVGVVLATQNPVDLDYKALSNAGTWFIGRLQTERDRKRLMDGLASAAGTVDTGQLERVIGDLEPRTFLLHNVHDDAPVRFRTRWAMSYLAGPLTRAQLRNLPGAAQAAAAPPHTRVTPAPPPPVSSSRPVLPPGLPQLFAVGTGEVARYDASAFGEARVHITVPGGSVSAQRVLLEAPLDPGVESIDWSGAAALSDVPRLSDEPVAGAAFQELPGVAGRKDAAPVWAKALADALYHGPGVTLYEFKRLRALSRPGESERDFRVRLADVLRAERDEQVGKLRKKYAPRIATLEGRIRRAEAALSRERDQAANQRVQSAVSLGATLLSAVLGRKALSQSTLGRATTTARGMSRATREQRDVARASQNLVALRAQREELAAQVEREVRNIDASSAAGADLTTRVIRPRKSDVEVVRVAVLWRPC